MNYHNIVHDDMLNGDGLRVTLFVSGCSHHCKECQNPQTWCETSGIPFTNLELDEIKEQLNKWYISGITFSGGDPLYVGNRIKILQITEMIKRSYPSKTIWCYTGYTYEELLAMEDDVVNALLSNLDVLVDGKYVRELRDTVLKWRGSSNQRVINMKETRKLGHIVLHCD